MTLGDRVRSRAGCRTNSDYWKSFLPDQAQDRLITGGAPARAGFSPHFSACHVVTRPLDERDHACGNEVVAYSPLSQSVSAQPAYTLGHAFEGNGLDNRWDDPNCRSSFVGHFAL